MKSHIKIFLDYHDYGEQDYIPCENCDSKAVDIHHLLFKSQGGKDEIENLISLCRECHTKAHNDAGFNEALKIIHLRNL